MTDATETTKASKVMITGASGFLGQWLARSLKEEGHEVHAVFRKAPAQKPKEIDFVHLGDVTNEESLKLAFKEMQAVFHLAGFIAYSKNHRQAMEQINVQGTMNVIQACRMRNVGRLVHVSSVAAIGAGFTPEQILNEESEYNLGHLNLGYFETKRAAEIAVRRACEKQSLDAVILNPSTIYGAGDAEKGTRSTQRKVARGRMPFYTSGGVNVVAVEDVVSSILAAWQRGRTGRRYIVASENLTLKQVFKIIADAAGVKPPRWHLPDAAVSLLGQVGDWLEPYGVKPIISGENAVASTLYNWFDSSRARSELGIQFRPAQFAIENSVRYMRDHHLLDH